MNKDEFIKELEKINIFPTNYQLEQLEQYYNLLVEWNKKINLTRIIEKEDVYLKHFYDSLTISRVINLKKKTNLLDFGTGAGFPGIVLKIVYPHLNITLVDSLQKRINFLNLVIKKLDLHGIDTYHKRIEELEVKHYDIITTRAVANLSKLIDYTHHLIDDDTLFIPLKANVDDEIIEATKIMNKYHLNIIKQDTFYLPNENSIRNILVIKKN